MDKPLEFFASDPPPRRAVKLNALSDKVWTQGGRIKSTEAKTATIEQQIQAIGGATGVVDPGDLTVYYENGKA